jgi:hypothetical protein
MTYIPVGPMQEVERSRMPESSSAKDAEKNEEEVARME